MTLSTKEGKKQSELLLKNTDEKNQGENQLKFMGKHNFNIASRVKALKDKRGSMNTKDSTVNNNNVKPQASTKKIKNDTLSDIKPKVNSRVAGKLTNLKEQVKNIDIQAKEDDEFTIIDQVLAVKKAASIER